MSGVVMGLTVRCVMGLMVLCFIGSASAQPLRYDIVDTIHEDFESVPLGSLPTDPGWEIHLNDGDASVAVSDEQVFEGNRSLKVTTGVNGGTFLRVPIERSAYLTWDVAVYAPEETASLYTGLMNHWEGASQTWLHSSVQLGFQDLLRTGQDDMVGSLCMIEGSCTYPIGRWMHIRMELDFVLNTLRIFKDGSMILEDAGQSNNYTHFALGIFYSGAQRVGYFDDVSVISYGSIPDDLTRETQERAQPHALEVTYPLTLDGQPDMEGIKDLFPGSNRGTDRVIVPLDMGDLSPNRDLGVNEYDYFEVIGVPELSFQGILDISTETLTIRVEGPEDALMKAMLPQAYTRGYEYRFLGPEEVYDNFFPTGVSMVEGLVEVFLDRTDMNGLLEVTDIGEPSYASSVAEEGDSIYVRGHVQARVEGEEQIYEFGHWVNAPEGRLGYLDDDWWLSVEDLRSAYLSSYIFTCRFQEGDIRLNNVSYLKGGDVAKNLRYEPYHEAGLNVDVHTFGSNNTTTTIVWYAGIGSSISESGPLHGELYSVSSGVTPLRKLTISLHGDPVDYATYLMAPDEGTNVSVPKVYTTFRDTAYEAWTANPNYCQMYSGYCIWRPIELTMPDTVVPGSPLVFPEGQGVYRIDLATYSTFMYDVSGPGEDWRWSHPIYNGKIHFGTSVNTTVNGTTVQGEDVTRVMSFWSQKMHQNPAFTGIDLYQDAGMLLKEVEFQQTIDTRFDTHAKRNLIITKLRVYTARLHEGKEIEIVDGTGALRGIYQFRPDGTLEMYMRQGEVLNMYVDGERVLADHDVEVDEELTLLMGASFKVLPTRIWKGTDLDFQFQGEPGWNVTARVKDPSGAVVGTSREETDDTGKASFKFPMAMGVPGGDYTVEVGPDPYMISGTVEILSPFNVIPFSLIEPEDFTIGDTIDLELELRTEGWESTVIVPVRFTVGGVEQVFNVTLDSADPTTVVIPWDSQKGSHRFTVQVDHMNLLIETPEGEADNVLSTTKVFYRNPIPYAGEARTVTQGTLVLFNGSATDEDGYIVSYEWDYNADGIYDAGPSPDGTGHYIFPLAGDYDVRLRVTDDDGRTSISVVLITVEEGEAPQAPIVHPGLPYSGYTGEPVSFVGSVTRGDVVLWEWDFTNDGVRDTSSNLTGDLIHIYDEPGEYVARLFGTSSNGLEGSATVDVSISDRIVIDLYADLGANRQVEIDEVVVLTVGVSDDVPVDSIRWDIDGDGEWDTELEDETTVSTSFSAMRTVVVKVNVTYQGNESHEDSISIGVFEPDVVVDDGPVDAPEPMVERALNSFGEVSPSVMAGAGIGAAGAVTASLLSTLTSKTIFAVSKVQDSLMELGEEKLKAAGEGRKKKRKRRGGAVTSLLAFLVSVVVLVFCYAYAEGLFSGSPMGIVRGNLSLSAGNTLGDLATIGIAVVTVMIGFELAEIGLARIQKVPTRFRIWGVGAIALGASAIFFGNPFGFPAKVTLESQRNISPGFYGRVAAGKSLFLLTLVLLFSLLSRVGGTLSVDLGSLPLLGGMMTGSLLSTLGSTVTVSLAGIGGLGSTISLMLFFYIMMPFEPLEGATIFKWNKGVWAGFFALSAGLFFTLPLELDPDLYLLVGLVGAASFAMLAIKEYVEKDLRVFVGDDGVARKMEVVETVVEETKMAAVDWVKKEETVGLDDVTPGSADSGLEGMNVAPVEGAMSMQEMLGSARECLRTGECGTALEWVNYAIESGHSTPDVYTLQATVLVRMGDHASALPAIEYALSQKPGNHLLLKLKSDAQILANDLNGALETVDHLIRTKPDFRPAWKNRDKVLETWTASGFDVSGLEANPPVPRPPGI